MGAVKDGELDRQAIGIRVIVVWWRGWDREVRLSLEPLVRIWATVKVVSSASLFEQ